MEWCGRVVWWSGVVECCGGVLCCSLERYSSLFFVIWNSMALTFADFGAWRLKTVAVSHQGAHSLRGCLSVGWWKLWSRLWKW